jgi:hypothetical protein
LGSLCVRSGRGCGGNMKLIFGGGSAGGSSLPEGGTEGQVLARDDSGGAEWVDLPDPSVNIDGGNATSIPVSGLGIDGGGA